MDFDPRHFLIKDRATFSQGIPRPGTCTFGLNATPEAIFAVLGNAPAPFMKRTKQGVYIALQPRDVHVSIDAGRACKGVGTPEEEYMELDHLQMVNFGVGFHVPRVANTDEPERVAINLQLILHEPGEALPFVLVEMYRYKDNSANIQIETLSGIQVQEPITTHGAFVEFQADQRAGRFRILVDGVEKWSTTYRAKVSPRFAVGVRAGTKIRIADSARIMLVTAPEQFSFKVPNPWRSICERPWELPALPKSYVDGRVEEVLGLPQVEVALSTISVSGTDGLDGAAALEFLPVSGAVRYATHFLAGNDGLAGEVERVFGLPSVETKQVLE